MGFENENGAVHAVWVGWKARSQSAEGKVHRRFVRGRVS